MTFQAPDEARFPAIRIARSAGQRGAWASTALIAADEIAVDRFLSGSLAFQDIASLASDAVERFGSGTGEPGVEALIGLDAEVRAWAETASPRQER